MRPALSILGSALSALFLSCCDDGEKKEFADDITEIGDEVEVIRDTNGVPHIYAESDTDAALVAGYETARDRLFQMDYLRRSAQGRLAEVYGESRDGVDVYAQDQLARAVGFYRSSEATAERLRKNEHDTYEIVSAYAAGVNAFIDDAVSGRNGAGLPCGFGPGELDYVPEPWQVTDSLAILKMSMFSLTTQTAVELIASLATAMGGDSPYLDELFIFLPSDDEFILDGFPDENAFLKKQATPGTKPRPDPKEVPRNVPDEVFRRGIAYARLFGRLGLGAGVSNNWAISGDLTASGRAILANDPHMELWCPSVLHMIHYATLGGGGTLDVAGWAFPGVPGVGLGFNRDVAWGTTVAFGDSADLFGVKLDADRRRAIFPDDRESLEILNEVFLVRPEGGSVGDCEEHEMELPIVPRYGPLLPGEADLFSSLFHGSDGIALKWAGSGSTLEMKAALCGNRGRTPGDIYDCMLDMTLGAMNWVYADRDGNIAYTAYAHYPVRKTLSRDDPPWLVLPSDGRFDWTDDVLPPENVPHALNPDRGFLVTANNDPVGATADNNPLNDAHYLGWSYVPGFRARVIASTLQDLAERARSDPDAGITVEEVKQLQCSEHARLADLLLPHLRLAWQAAQAGGDPVLEALAADPNVATAFGMLDSWDRVSDKDSAAAALFYAWASAFNALAIRDELGGTLYDAMPFIYTIRPLIAYLDDRPTSTGRDYFDILSTSDREETREEIALSSLAQAFAFLADRFGPAPDQWRWGAYQQLHIGSLLGDPLRWGPLERGGMNDTVNVNNTQFSGTGGRGELPENMTSQGGAATRFVVTWDSEGWPLAEFSVPGGQSADPDDPHFDDLLDDWLGMRYRKFPFRREDVEAAQEGRVTFPAGFPRVRE